MLHEIIEKLESVPATLVGGIFLIASFVLPMFAMDFGIYFAWVTIFICGTPLVYSAIRKLIKNKGISKISSALLISIAMISAVLIKDLFAAAEVAFIMAIGEILEHFTTKRAKKGLKNLINLAPTQGRKIIDGKETIIKAEEILLGDILRIFPGEAIPVDGVIISGETSVNQSVMTGESIPVDKVIGDEVFSGTINCFGSIDIKVTKVGENSSLQKLISMVKNAESKKAPMQRIADKWASVLVPLALVVAVITYFVTKDITRAVTVLVVFCPCALVLATPTAIMAAIGQATKYGVIIKSGDALEKMGKVDTIAFDKTGTITFGKLEVCDVIPCADISKTELIETVASAEAKSEHPLGKAIVFYAKEQNIVLQEIIDFKMTSGKGIVSKIKCSKKQTEKIVLCGNEKFLTEHNIRIDEAVQKQINSLRLQGKASVLVADEKSILGIISLSDMIRPETFNIIQNLQKLKTDSVLLTGDNENTAEYFASKAGIKNVLSNLLPEQKVEQIVKMQSSGKTICMIGDGINDAPALKTADVGIAMGVMGSDIAVEAADIALMTDDITKIPYLKRLSNATVKTIQSGIFLSMFINIVGVILSVLGWLNPTTGALVHNAGAIFVVLIATLLYDRKFGL